MKKKILIIIPDLRIGGGAQKVVSDLSINLSKNYDLSILTFIHHRKLYSFKGEYYSFRENLKFIPKIHPIFRPFRIYKLIKKISPDIILSFMDNANITAIITKRLFRINLPLINSVRCNIELVYRDHDRYINFLIKLLYRLNTVNKIVTVSKGVQSILEKSYGIQKSKLKTINNGIDIEKIKKLSTYKIVDHAEIFKDKDLVKFILVGRLSKEKGYESLIEAFHKVKQQISKSKLIIIGDGPLKKNLKSILKMKFLENDIILLGFKKNPYKYLIKSDIFVLSSKYEGFPNVLLEAFACGLPIISTNCKTGPKEILDYGKYGLLVSVYDSKELAEKMILLAKNHELTKQYSKLSLKRAMSFNLETLINEWICLFESYLN